MSNRGRVKDGAEGQERPSVPSFLGLRARVQTLYRARRRRVLEVPIAELERRYGSTGHEIEVDEVDYRAARVDLDDGTTIEIGFKGTFRLFGALIDTQIVGRRGQPSDPARYEYRFDRQAFVVAPGGLERGARWLSGPEEDVARQGRTERIRALADDRVVELAGRSELKSMVVIDGRADGRQVELTPLAGTITAVYFPPLPPYTVLLKPAEVRDHLELVERLLDPEI